MITIHVRELKSLLIASKRSNRPVSFVLFESSSGRLVEYRSVRVLSVDVRKNKVVVKLPISLAIRRLRLFLFYQYENMLVYL